ncbi:MAG: HAMP domain-containing sensor histidine kinase [Eubacteriales bacterium]|nr:HAMP domain-containing sensor histidine kinase [Eubacteriales bacterium]
MNEPIRESAVNEEATVNNSPETVHVIPPQNQVPLTHRTAVKFTAFILLILMAFLAVCSVLAAIVMIDAEIYTTPAQTIRYNIFSSLTQNDAHKLITYLGLGTVSDEQIAENYLSGRNIASVELYFSEEERQWSYKAAAPADNTVYKSTWYHVLNRDTGASWYEWTDYAILDDNSEITDTIEVSICLTRTLNTSDEYYYADLLVSAAYALRYWIYGIGLASAILIIACFVFLLSASGRRAGYTDPQPGWGTRIPLDVLTAAVGFAAFALIQLTHESTYFMPDLYAILLFIPCFVVLLVMVLGWCMSMALRIKLGGWWKNTVIFYALRLARIVLGKLWAGLRRIARGALSLLRSVPLVWKTSLCLTAIAVIEFFAILFSYGEWDVLTVFWAFKNLIIGPALLYAALMLRKLQKGGEALASGDLSYQIDTGRMLWDFKRHGENLNSIGEGMTAAVEQRMKSERMKTELITNVSHDIKTPLTSIINYSDLIGKEPCENEKITEYADVLHRQSKRLKNLIEDLVEASKASTGNLEILLAPCEVGVMLSQTVGEYEQRMKQCQLELMTAQPDAPVTILADGRRLWRVFDNLMNNACKYAQPGTRVYLTLEKINDQAVISFKNTSREALNLPADELLERFVQGDSARKTDGNGLGLSIAKSLTELQNGTMQLTVDGDLFKVILRFPVLR